MKVITSGFLYLELSKLPKRFICSLLTANDLNIIEVSTIGNRSSGVVMCLKLPSLFSVEKDIIPDTTYNYLTS